MRKFYLYNYCTRKLRFNNITKYVIVGIAGLLIGSNLVTYNLAKNVNAERYVQSLSPEERLIILSSSDEFSEEKFIHYLKELNVKFPYIVYAQAMLETGNFKSKVFRENNNLFGMKCATSRATTNKGEQYNHAMFDTWRESIMDYALYQSRYLNSIRSEEQYYSYLSSSYAEDSGYVNKLRAIVDKENLKEKFDKVQLSYR